VIRYFDPQQHAVNGENKMYLLFHNKRSMSRIQKRSQDGIKKKIENLKINGDNSVIVMYEFSNYVEK
jgi:hypothetical protein